MKNILFTILILTISISIHSQTIFGKWNSKNENTGQIDSVIEVYEKEGKAYAKVIEILNKKIKNPICQNCNGENKDKPILGLNILTGLEKDGDEWSGGEILDPRNGKIYKCYIQLVENNKLKLRGYVGISLFGKTRYWYRAGK
jgi:uncharacterized protein (DUF2147 family)